MFTHAYGDGSFPYAYCDCTSKTHTESAASPFRGTAPDASAMKPLHPRKSCYSWQHGSSLPN